MEWVVKWVGKIDKVVFEDKKYIFFFFFFASSNASALNLYFMLPSLVKKIL